MVQLPGFRVQHDDAGLKAVKGRVPFGHLHVTVLAQDDGAGGVFAVVVVVDQIGLFGEGVQPVLLAGLQKDLALGVGGLGADEVAHVGKADREMLAIRGGTDGEAACRAVLWAARCCMAAMRDAVPWTGAEVGADVVGADAPLRVNAI